MATSQTQSTEIAVRNSTNLEAVGELYEILLGRQQAAEIMDDPDAIGDEILAQLLAAESDEQLSLGKAEGWRDHLDTPYELHDFKWRKSEFDEGGPIYLIVQARNLDTGEPTILTTGSKNIVAQLANMARRGTLRGGVWKAVQAEKATQRGFFPLWLEKVRPETVEVLRAALSNPLLEEDETAAA